MERVTVTAHGYYRGATTTVRAAVRQSKDGRRYLEVNRRQMMAAADRCCYAGDDCPVLAEMPEYTEWRQHNDGSWLAYERVK